MGEYAWRYDTREERKPIEQKERAGSVEPA